MSSHTITRTAHLQTTVLCRTNQRHPTESQQHQPNDCSGAHQQGQKKQNSGNDQIIQIEKLRIMAKSLHQQARCLFHVKWTFFSESKKHRRAANVLAFEHASHILLGRLWNTGRHTSECFIATARVPFLFTVLLYYNSKQNWKRNASCC